jgi:hypothetical protein
LRPLREFLPVSDSRASATSIVEISSHRVVPVRPEAFKENIFASRSWMVSWTCRKSFYRKTPNR